MENALIIFVRNPILGQVKSRLAKSVGTEKALEIYHQLLLHTKHITLESDASRHLFYSDFVDYNDDWSNEDFNKYMQDLSSDLGKKMHDAFHQLRNKGFEKILIIGSDCLELQADLINSAYKLLNQHDAIIGPAIDGGFYCLGLNTANLDIDKNDILSDLFLNKKWSHENVCEEAISVFENHSIRFAKLPTLNDIDEEKDLKEMRYSQSEI